MAWSKMWRIIAVGGALLAALVLSADGVAAERPGSVQTTSPTYAIPLREGNTAIVWWDAFSDPANPGWRCEIPSQGGGAARTITPLTAAAGDWRAALVEARELLKDRVADPK